MDGDGKKKRNFGMAAMITVNVSVCFIVYNKYAIFTNESMTNHLRTFSAKNVRFLTWGNFPIK